VIPAYPKEKTSVELLGRRMLEHERCLSSVQEKASIPRRFLEKGKSALGGAD